MCGHGGDECIIIGNGPGNDVICHRKSRDVLLTNHMSN